MPLAHLSFLVAEDHAFQRGMLVTMLEKLGAGSVREAAGGHDALAIVKDSATPVDIIISDLDMPGMDGMEFIRHLGAMHARVSIILASALDRVLLASIGTMTEAYGIKLLGVVEKPLTPGKLMPLIDRHKSIRAEAHRPARAAFTLEEVMAGLKNGEFEPFFQPQIEFASRRVLGAEALARWRHPQEGIIAPFAFIGLLEGHEKIDDLMWEMLRKSARCSEAWRRSGLDVAVSVNLSIKSLSNPDLADRVTAIVRSQGVDPARIVMEVTESTAATDLAKALENLARLRMKGFGLSIDDYGTGYSSMQQLTRIAFTELKIDQSFVANAAGKVSDRIMVESSLDMAKKLGITSVAEGIETQENWNLLRDMRCDIGQGYFIARPMEAGAFPNWCREWAGLP